MTTLAEQQHATRNGSQHEGWPGWFVAAATSAMILGIPVVCWFAVTLLSVQADVVRLREVQEVRLQGVEKRIERIERKIEEGTHGIN